MQHSLQKLQKFFRLEAERGFDNRAVVGGLDKILSWWEAEARAEKVTEEVIQIVSSTLHDYQGIEQEKRQETLRTLWRTLQPDRKDDFPAAKPVQNPRPRPEPASEAHNEPARTHQPGEETRPPRIGSQAIEQTISRRPSPSFKKAVDPDSQSSLGLNAPLTVIPGIGPKTADTLTNLGLYNLRDLLYYFPRRYIDYSQLKPIHRLWYGEEVTVIGTIQSVSVRPIRGGSSTIIEAVISDGSGALRLTWFNQPWIASRLREGTAISVSGRIDQHLGRLMMAPSEWEPLEQEQLHTNRIVPVYPLTARVTQHWIRRIMHQTVRYWAPRVNDYLPETTRQSARLVDLPTALIQIHLPDSADQLKAAQDRLAFDEVFLLQLGVLNQKRNWHDVTARVFETPDEWLDQQVACLPFTLTDAQLKAIREIHDDLLSGHPMNRLLQGDVGSGKTVVAALGIAMVVRHGAQAAIMAPTSILAEQHYRNLSGLLAGQENGAVLAPNQIRLLIGDTPETEKEEIRQGLADGTIKLVIGTHALIEDPITFDQLQMVVVDEQHRFGVEQRAALRQKGENPHLLVMTATPIPRSLALTIYGDLDLSVMDEMPAGRQTIETHIVFPRERERAYTLINTQIEQGRQAFIICPYVEQNGNDEAKAAVEEHARLQNEVFPRHKLGLLHGRMRPDEKEKVMAQFRDNEYHILVSTSVVEVGVDIPNATVMLIEGANRFGLAQLHQFRGRVGRGSSQSYCLLVPESEDTGENERLKAMVETNDGFVLAERDLQQRGPGEFLGTRQSGYASVQMASLTDIRLIEKARDQAQELFSQDPNLSSPELSPLANTLRRFWGDVKGDIS